MGLFNRNKKKEYVFEELPLPLIPEYIIRIRFGYNDTVEFSFKDKQAIDNCIDWFINHQPTPYYILEDETGKIIIPRDRVYYISTWSRMRY